MSIAIICDLHLGPKGSGQWHNKMLFDYSEKIVEKTVFSLNSHRVDLVVILGDITHNGKEEELLIAIKILSKLTMPWLILPGNHDRPSMQSGMFKKLFEKHIPCLYSHIENMPSIFLTDDLSEINSAETELGHKIINRTAEKVKSENPGNLLIFSHIPLISQKDYARKFNAQYVPHYIDGLVLLNKLSKYVSGKIFTFSGHEHWHLIKDSRKYPFCSTASLIEYPMEYRIISFGNNKLIINTPESSCPDIAELSLISAKWVRGLRTDRDCTILTCP